MKRWWLLGLIAALPVLGTGCRKWNEPARKDAVSGTIEVDEARVASRYGGRIEEIFAREGDLLKPGEIMIRLSAPELAARQARFEAFLAELKAGPRKEELETARLEWQAQAAELAFAEADLKRVAELFEAKTVSAAERDRAATRAASLEKSVAAAKSQYDLLAAGTRPERIAQAQAELAETAAQLREMEIRAPTNAVLEVLHVKTGDVAGPNEALATVLLPSHLWVRVYVPEPWLGHIGLGEKVRLRVDAYPGRDFTGEVEQVARAAEFTPRNVQTVSDRVRQVFGVKIRLPAESDLRAGMAADAYFANVPKE